MLEVKNLAVRYGKMRAVSDVSIQVAKGQLVALVGANGAGKSTTLRAISGLVQPDGGTILLEGKSIVGESAFRIARRGIGHVPEGRGVLATLSVAENLKLGAMNRPSAEGLKRDQERVFEFFPILKKRHGQLAGLLSGGEQQMLSIGRALLSAPKLLIIDEMSLGLAPKLVHDLMAVIVQLVRSGMAVLCVEQNTKLILKYADHGYVIETGRTVIEGSGLDLSGNDQIVNSYLGHAA
jgi:branched-chain amino acid transport system ATP-binding protein